MRSLAGGFHQSSDLRKWVFGTTLGLSALAEYALEAEPARDQKIIGENLWHGAKYLLSLITEEGWLIDCTWIPEGYDTKLAGKGYGDSGSAGKTGNTMKARIMSPHTGRRSNFWRSLHDTSKRSMRVNQKSAWRERRLSGGICLAPAADAKLRFAGLSAFGA